MPRDHRWASEWGSGPRFGVNLNAALDWPTLRTQVQILEAAGFDALFVPDHPLLMGDAWTTLAVIAGATDCVRIGTMVSCVAYHHPVTLARIASDVDRISNGRVILGLGSGDMAWEFERLGLDYGTGAQRLTRLSEALSIIEPLLAGETVTFEGEFFRVRDVVLDPRPVQDPVPILIAGGGRGTLRLAARHAHAVNIGAASWAGGAYTADDIADRWVRLRESCSDHDRNFDSVLRTGLINLKLAKTRAQAQSKVDALPDRVRNFFQQLFIACTPEEAVQHLQAMLDAGYQYIVFQGLDPETLELLTSGVLPSFRTQAATA